MHRLDSGHFAVEDSLDEIAGKIKSFHERSVAPPVSTAMAAG
jgi:hypothetical protein